MVNTVDTSTYTKTVSNWVGFVIAKHNNNFGIQKKYLPLCACSNQSTSILCMSSSVLNVGIVPHFNTVSNSNTQNTGKIQAYADSGTYS